MTASASAFDGGARAKEGLDHLQAAALQAIEAARAFLDIAEELVREPGVVGDVARAASAMATAMRDEASPGPGGAAGHRGAAATAPARPQADSNVRRIPLS